MNIKGLKKNDEMELSINFKAMRISWLWYEIALAIFCIITTIVAGEFPIIEFVIWAIGGVLYWNVKVYVTKKMTETTEENE